jgi:hypothetical protein
MRVRILRSVATAYGVFRVGEVVDHPRAASLVCAGYAVPVEEDARHNPLETATRPKRRRNAVRDS